jgi:hypothetical protein
MTSDGPHDAIATLLRSTDPGRLCLGCVTGALGALDGEPGDTRQLLVDLIEGWEFGVKPAPCAVCGHEDMTLGLCYAA